MEKIRVGGIIDNSLANGKGLRMVLFLSGCLHKCEGCHNKELQDFDFGVDMTEEEIFARIEKNAGVIKGITLSGGDPMEQPAKLINLCRKIRALDLDIWCYTGYSFEEVLKSEEKLALLKEVDVLVDGRFDLKLKSEKVKYRGSSNQRIIDVKESLKTNEIVEIIF